MVFHRIEDYGIIGDLHTVGLVSIDGSLDYLCLPDFDSPTVFAKLLDDANGGNFQIGPAASGARLRQLYLPDTNVLLTRFLSTDGVGEVTDFMPVGTMRHAHAVVRRVKGVRGRFRFRLNCAPRFDYGRRHHSTTQNPGEILFHTDGADGLTLRLHTPVAARIVDGDVDTEFELGPDETLDFVLEAISPDAETPAAGPRWAERAYTHAVAYWRDWAAQATYQGRWRSEVIRSALALKLLTSQRHGAIAAAATFGLPELVGGERNWDYRYTWIRDGSLTAAALVDLGFTDEPRAFLHWIGQRYDESTEPGRLQIMYGIDGRPDLTETTLPHLDGYASSRPVRIGNGAHRQVQLDIYGELLHLVERFDDRVEPVTYELWCHLRASVDWVVANWRRADEGIWEVRGGPQEFLYARLMCWVALDRALRIAQRRSLPAPIQRWWEARDDIHREIHEQFWDPGRRAFVQHRGACTVDAASLLMPLAGFLSPVEPRWLDTLKAIDRELVEDSLVYRYRTAQGADDGLSGTEGTFCMCSFWFIHCLTLAGDLDRAQFYFEKMHSYANHLGLYAEEMDGTGRYLGNFPQAFTHLGLIGAARSLDAALTARNQRVRSRTTLL
ncbi:glycoside hydrolase family 15 protein [Actinoplanes regularis]|uniref:Glucoamylase (Glucan-1,4-alpha-glucosidase), GH15 family n=1 Tax=Actinoplanes regularis TaxID=52697 RepID=A0A238Z3T6_9ACTN|nr:glycoside hydrolase family 15 protein [Actinoplanes regularis]GIE85810.1 glucoamylase [Actinoplanes regularis]SNR78125.1 Glucoamylase (glucan-1,4-alpha-glucosidase), GH15 family [Actinoplanes regularis]